MKTGFEETFSTPKVRNKEHYNLIINTADDTRSKKKKSTKLSKHLELNDENMPARNEVNTQKSSLESYFSQPLNNNISYFNTHDSQNNYENDRLHRSFNDFNPPQENQLYNHEFYYHTNQNNSNTQLFSQNKNSKNMQQYEESKLNLHNKNFTIYASTNPTKHHIEHQKLQNPKKMNSDLSQYYYNSLPHHANSSSHHKPSFYPYTDYYYHNNLNHYKKDNYNKGTFNSPRSMMNYGADYKCDNFDSVSMQENDEDNSFKHFDFVKQIADGIIQQKDEIIESQRQKIEELERDSQSPNLDMALLTQNKQVCAMEYQLSEMKTAARKQKHQYQQQLIALQKTIEEKEKNEKEWMCQIAKLEQDLKINKQKIDQQNKYFCKLPSRDEHLKNLEELKDLKKKMEKFNKEYSEEKKELHHKIETEKKEKEKEKIDNKSISKELDNLRNELIKLKGDKKELEMELKTRLDLQELKAIKKDAEKKREAYEKHVKILEMKLHQREGVLEDEKSKCNLLNDKLASSEKSLETLWRDYDEMEQETLELKESLKSLTTKKEDLNGSNQGIYKEKEDCKEWQCMLGEVERCAMEMKAVVEFMLDRLSGREADVRVLLGLSDLKLSDSGLSKEDLRKMVRGIKEGVDEVKALLSDIIAEEMGRRLTCNHQ